MLWTTKFFSVRNLKDLITRTVRVADVFGRARLVVRVEISEVMEPLQENENCSQVPVWWLFSSQGYRPFGRIYTQQGVL